MRWSQSLIPTLRQVPAEAVAPSHQLMLRAGLIHQVAAGAYSYLPLGWRVLNKAIGIVRREMDAAGAVEVFLPTLQPIEWWEQTGRRVNYGDNLFVVKDRHGREQALGPTHEEVITKLVDAFVSSYRQLPINLYQIQTKFRDEFRPRFGVLRSREFQMKDAYSFHLAIDGDGGLNETYQVMYDTYCRIFERCGLPYVIVEAESGPIGGSASHEFMVPCPTGEDFILSSDKHNYAANVEKCEIGPRETDLEADPTDKLEKVHTPGASSIEDVCAFWKKSQGSKLKPQNMLKTLVYRTEDQWFVAVVRGDHELNEAKLKAACGASELSMADDIEARSHGFAIGFVGPQVALSKDELKVFVDPDAAQGGFWVTGANEPDHHVKHFNWQRDVLQPLGIKPGQSEASARVTIADIRNAEQGDPSPKNDGGVLQMSKGIEIGHVFKLGSKYTKALGVKVLDDKQQEITPIMGCYGIGINRILAAAIERDGGHDDNGIIWPMSLAPYQVVITPIKYEGQARQVADDLYAKLTEQGAEVLLDDRAERPGVKFKDADLIGIPIRLVIGEKGLANGQVELKQRDADKPDDIALESVVERVMALINRS